MDVEWCKKIDSLVSRFYSGFDYSSMLAVFEGRMSGMEIPAQIGEGSHFTTYKFSSSHRLGDYVFKVSHKWGLDEIALGKLSQALLSIKDQSICLIPPFELFEFDGKLGLVMPFGEETKVAEAKIAIWAKIMQQQLSAKGLEIADHLQIRFACGVPFITDLSDLQKC